MGATVGAIRDQQEFETLVRPDFVERPVRHLPDVEEGVLDDGLFDGGFAGEVLVERGRPDTELLGQPARADERLDSALLPRAAGSWH